MVLKLSDSITQKIVDSIYGNCGYHGIVCDDTGTIIADSNSAQSRIGIQHKGSMEILTNGSDFAFVTAADAVATEGRSKEGFSHEQAMANQEIAKLVEGVQLVSQELQSLSSDL